MELQINFLLRDKFKSREKLASLKTTIVNLILKQIFVKECFLKSKDLLSHKYRELVNLKLLLDRTWCHDLFLKCTSNPGGSRPFWLSQCLYFRLDPDSKFH